MSVNLIALEALPAEAKTARIPAYLEKSNGDRLTFLYNPSEKAQSTKAVYSEAPTFGAAIPEQVFQHAAGITLELSNLLVDTFASERNVQPLIDSYVGLTKLRDEVKFVWGSNSFGPAVVTAVAWTETLWLNGNPAFGYVNLTLLQVPVLPEASGAPIPETAPDVPLTNRQVDSGLTSVSSFLDSNSSRFLASAQTDPLQINTAGIVSRGIDQLGQWDGLRFKPSDLFRL